MSNLNDLRIVKLTAENYKRLKAVEITPTGELVEITGRNKQGKTSVLDAIWAALENVKVGDAMPIRRGANKAVIRVDLGEIVVQRLFTEKGSKLTVEGADGAQFPSPQTMLDSLLGALSFDPLEFSRMKPREQYDALRKVAQVDVDFDHLDALNRTDYEKRTEVNRDAKAKRAQAEGVRVPADLPAQPLDETAILNQMQQAAAQNANIEKAKAARTRRDSDADGISGQANLKRLEAADLRKRAEVLEAAADDLDKQAAERRAQNQSAPPLPEPVDVSALRVELDRAKAVNQGFELKARRDALKKEDADLEARSKELTERIEARATAKADAIARAQMPVPGLGFGDGVVTLQGVPLEQGSSAELIQLSLAIAMKANPKIRVIRIKDGSLLDDDSLRLVAEMAKASGYQVWVERVDMTGKIGVVIEDGSVVSVDGQPAKPARVASA